MPVSSASPATPVHAAIPGCPARPSVTTPAPVVQPVGPASSTRPPGRARRCAAAAGLAVGAALLLAVPAASATSTTRHAGAAAPAVAGAHGVVLSVRDRPGADPGRPGRPVERPGPVLVVDTTASAAPGGGHPSSSVSVSGSPSRTPTSPPASYSVAPSRSVSRSADVAAAQRADERDLAHTGTKIGVFAALGALVLVAGAAVLVFARRREF